MHSLMKLRSFIFSVSDHWDYHKQQLEVAYLNLVPFSQCERSGNGGSKVADQSLEPGPLFFPQNNPEAWSKLKKEDKFYSNPKLFT